MVTTTLTPSLTSYTMPTERWTRLEGMYLTNLDDWTVSVSALFNV